MINTKSGILPNCGMGQQNVPDLNNGNNQRYLFLGNSTNPTETPSQFGANSSLFQRNQKVDPKFMIVYPPATNEETNRLNQSNRVEKVWRINYADGGKYFGELSNNKRDGSGRYFFANGNTYEGEWQLDKIHGRGVASFSNGDSYVGEWEDGKFNGIGTYSFASKYIVNNEKQITVDENIFHAKLEGQWVMGQLHGIATITYLNGNKSASHYFLNGIDTAYFPYTNTIESGPAYCSKTNEPFTGEIQGQNFINGWNTREAEFLKYFDK